jgi:zinc protease
MMQLRVGSVKRWIGRALPVGGLMFSAVLAWASVLPYEVQRSTLDNGLKVLLIPMPSDGLVAYWSIVRTGSRDEVEEGVTGFAHFFEHMMFRGSEKYPGPIYDGIVKSMGASANAFTSDDLTAYHLAVTREDLPQVIEIESDRFQRLKYSEAEFRTEAGAVYGEFRKGRTNPFFVLYEAVSEAAFDRHTYRHTTIGFEADIRRMPEQFEYSKGFFRRFYRPENVVILVVGDFDPGSTLRLIREKYGGWPRGYVAPEVPVEPEQTSPQRLEIPFDGETLPIVSVNFKGARLDPSEPLMPAAVLLGSLAFGETSALHRKLVLEEQRLQFLQGDFGYNRDPGLWSIYGMVKDPADVAAVEGEIWNTIGSLQRELVDSARLEAVRSNLKFGFLSGLSTPSTVAQGLARFIALTGDVEAIDQLWAAFERVTPEDVRAAARRYLTAERSTVAVLHTRGQAIPRPAATEPPVLLPVAADPNVSFKLWFKVGSEDDPKDKRGLAALTGALIGEGGTQRRSYDQILEKLFPLAGSYGASVDKEMTVVSGLVHRDAVSEFYPLFLDALLNPGFRAEDFDRIKSRTISVLEKELRYSSDEELGKAALYGAVFEGTPYEHLDLGTVAGLKAITLEDVRRFHARYFTRDNVVIGLGGAYGERLPDQLLADLQRLPAGRPEPTPAPGPRGIAGRKVILVQKPGESTAISLGYPIALNRGAREFYALWVANSWLGEHRNSVGRLFQVIREERGMNYGDYSYIEAFPNGGQRTMPPTGVGRRQQLFEVWIRPVPHDRAVFALRAALREVEHLAKNGLTREQFEAQRAFLKKYSYQFATTTSARLGYAIDDRFYTVPEGHLTRFRAMMDELTLEEVNAAIRKYLRVDDLVIAMVTADAEALKHALVSDAPSPIHYGEIPKPEETLLEDKEIERYPLTIRAEDVVVVPIDEMFAR